jgi:hypothetical protein
MMRRFAHSLWAKFIAHEYRRNIARALALHHRGEVRGDGLIPISIYTTVEIEWSARDIHPWDRALQGDERNLAFVAQTLSDTDAAISRLFEALPQMDALQLRVVGPHADNIMCGTVYRPAVEEPSTWHSTGMKLKQLGVTFGRL